MVRKQFNFLPKFLLNFSSKLLFLSFFILFTINIPPIFAGNKSCNNSCNSGCITKSIFIPRSVGSNLERETFAVDDRIHAEQNCNNLIVGSFVFQYERSFDGKNIAKSLFGTDTLNFVGSQVQSRSNSGTAGCCDLIADYFGLSINSNTQVNLKPVIQNFIWDLEFYLGLDKYVSGLYLKINSPLTYSSWDLFSNKCSPCSLLTATTLDTTPFPPCYMATGTVLPTTNIVDALSGVTNFTDGWAFGKFRFCPIQKLELADIDVIVGYDFFRTDCNHLGIFGQLVAPTNKRPNPFYVFSPVIGDHHWKLGGGITAHHKFFEDACQWWGVYFEANLLHFLSDTQLRTFDFVKSNSNNICCNNNLSRYMLLTEFTSNGEVYSSTGNIISAVNFTTRKINIKLNIECDANLKFSCHHENWTFDVGYNFYAKSKEKGNFINNSCCQPDSSCCSSNTTFDGRYFGFKGTEGVCCSSYNITTTFPTRTLVSPQNSAQILNCTQSNASMCAVLGSNLDDNPVPQETTPLPLDGSATVCLTWNSTRQIGSTYINNTGVANPSGIIVAQQSVPPVIITNINNSILNKESGLVNAQIIQKFFIHASHEWDNCWSPYLGLGLSAEFAQTGKDCHYAGLSKWSLMVKTGLNF